jgi:hypothetical protein
MIFRGINMKSIAYSIIYIIYQLYEIVFGYPNLKKQFKERLGYDLDLKNPVSFNQKLTWKKVYDRNPLLPVVADKYRVRKYIQNKLGKQKADQILIPLLYDTDKPESIPFDSFPSEYIIKATHRSGENIIVTEEKQVNRSQIVKQCENLLVKPYGLLKHEWPYQKVPRKIIVEKLLRDSSGKLPKDYKIHMLNDKCVLIMVVDDRFGNIRKNYYTQDWKLLDIEWEGHRGAEIPKPQKLNEMLEISRLLSKPFDFIRVDLYSVDDEIYFGELTHYPFSGMGKFIPQRFDFELGSSWNLEPGYWKRYRK